MGKKLMPLMDGKQKIMAAAKEVIAEKGISGATLRGIASTAGLSTGAIYHYYASKDEILYDVMSESLSVSSHIVEKCDQGLYSEEALIEEIVNNIRSRFDKHIDNRIQLHLAQEAIQGNDVLKTLFQEKYKEWIHNDEVMLKFLYKDQGESLQGTLASLLLAAIDGLILQSELGARQVEVEKIVEFYRTFLKVGVPFLLDKSE